MSRSRRKTPIMGMTTSPSDKPSKRIGHKQERAAVRAALAHRTPMPSPKRYGDPCKSEKDGKQYAPEYEKVWRK